MDAYKRTHHAPYWSSADEDWDQCWQHFFGSGPLRSIDMVVNSRTQSLLPNSLWALQTWCRHQMETFPASLAICAGHSPVPCEFPSQRPVTQSFDAFVDLRLNTRLSKQSIRWWFETPSRPSWRHCNECIGYWYQFRHNSFSWFTSANDAYR